MSKVINLKKFKEGKEKYDYSRLTLKEMDELRFFFDIIILGGVGRLTQRDRNRLNQYNPEIEALFQNTLKN